jgi:hypothetical protein
MTMTTITTIAGVVAALGGERATAKRLGCDVSHVQTWVPNQHIPNGWHLRVYLIAKYLGHDIKLTVFEINEQKFIL